MALVTNLSLPDWDEWRIEMLERRRRRWRDRVRDRVRVRVVANAQVSIEGVTGSEKAGEKRKEREEEVVVIKEAEEKEEEGGNEIGRGVEEGEMIEGDERVGVEEEGEENEVEREVEVNGEVGEEVREEVEEEGEEENEVVGEEIREEVKEEGEEENGEVGEEVREEVKEEGEEENGEVGEEVREEVKEEGEEENGEVGEEVREEVKEEGEEENGEVGEEVREEVTEEGEEENGVVGEMEAEEMEEQQEENAFEREVEEAEGEEVENEVEHGVDAEEEEGRQVREEEQIEEEDNGEEEHQEQEQNGQNHLAEQLRRIEDENIWQNQESTSRQDSILSEEGNSSNEVEYDDEDSDGDYYNFDRINNEDRAVVKQYKPPEELEEPGQKSWMNKNSILGGERKEEDFEKLTGEKVTVAAPLTTQEVYHKKPQTEEEDSTDDEEAEDSADEEEEEEEDSDDEDVVKVYRKDDYPTDLFRTLTEFKDSSVLTDLILSTKKGKSFHVHSPVLAAVSSRILRCLSRSYYRRYVRKQTSVGVKQWSVTLGPEVDHVGLEAVVEFAYTGLITCLNSKTLQKIRAAAQTLGAPRVLQLCKQEEEKPFKPKKQREEETVPTAEQLMINLQSIKQLWMDKVGCDVILEALGGSLHVHRVILAVCSDYFRGMFTSGMRETNQPLVTLPHLLSSELEVLIGCSYRGAVLLNWKCVFDITMTALQLQYQPVLSLSLNFLHQEINSHSCLDLASFAEAYEMAQLLEAADDFVLRQFQKVACTAKFKDLPAKQLLKYLNSRSLCVPSELVVFKAVVAWIQARPKVRLKLVKELMKTIHFPLMTFKEFKEVQSLNMWSDHRLAELFEAIFEDFCSNEIQCRIYLPKESLVLIGGDHTSEDLASRSISRELWFGNSLRNHTGVKKAMEWRKLGEMPEPERFSHEVAVLKGQLYVFGGKKYYGLHDNLNSVYRYDPLQNSWESLAEMMDRRCSFSVVVLDEKIYAIGGHCDPYFTDTVELYCPTTNSWSFTWPLDLPLGCHVAKVLQGQIYVSGGLSNENQYLASMILYNPEAGSTYLANMAKPRARHCMETLGEYLYVAGGITANDDLSISDQLACEVYNPVANSWTAFTPLPVPHVGAAGAVLEGKFYVLGGYSQEDYSDTRMVHRYDPATQRWENMGSMPGPNNDIRASVLCLPQHFRS